MSRGTVFYFYFLYLGLLLHGWHWVREEGGVPWHLMTLCALHS